MVLQHDRLDYPFYMLVHIVLYPVLHATVLIFMEIHGTIFFQVQISAFHPDCSVVRLPRIRPLPSRIQQQLFDFILVNSRPPTQRQCHIRDLLFFGGSLG